MFRILLPAFLAAGHILFGQDYGQSFDNPYINSYSDLLFSKITGTHDWQITDGMLRSSGPEASGAIYFSKSFSVTHHNELSWSIRVKYDNSPSGSNYVRFYLSTSSASLDGQDGLYLQMGESGSEDGIHLMLDNRMIIQDTLRTISSGIDHQVTVNYRPDSGFKLNIRDANGNLVAEYHHDENIEFSGNHCGVFIKHTSSRNESFLVDDLLLSSIDISGPDLTDFRFIPPNQLNLKFSEALDSVDVLNRNNYHLNGQLPSKIFYIVDSLQLFFDSPFQNGESYDFTFTTTDLSGNTVYDTLVYYYVEIEKAAFGDIIISEIFADPSPMIGLPEFEYLELYNRSQKFINLAGWTIGGISGSFLGNFLFPPQTYLLVSSENALEFFPDSIQKIGWESAGAYNITNSGEVLTLYDDTEKLIDRVIYDQHLLQDEQREGGWSLEIRKLDAACFEPLNWSGSTNPSGGTPGFENSVKSNLVAFPTVKGFLFDEEKIEIILNHHADTSKSDPRLHIDEHPTSFQFYNNSSLAFELPQITPGKLMQIALSQVNNCFGNVLDTFFVAGIGKKPYTHELIITEIMADPEPSMGLPEHEYLEIYNPTSQIIELNGLMLADERDTVLMESHQLPSGEYLLLIDGSGYNDFTAKHKMAIKLPDLRNSGETISLFSDEGVIHQVTYDPQTAHGFAEDGGVSLEMIDVNYPCIGMDNWEYAFDIHGGTPGLKNSVATEKPDLTGPEIKKAYAIRDSIFIHFNEKIDTTNISAVSIITDPELTINKKIVVDESTIVLKVEQINEDEIIMQLEGVTDCSGNQMDSQSLLIGNLQKFKHGELLINEILFDPFSGGVDFVEILNISTHHGDIGNITFVIGEEDPVNFNIEIPIAPGQHLAITNDKITLSNQYPQSSKDNHSTLEDLPNLKDEGLIRIFQDSMLLDSVFYNEDMHHELIFDTEGISLERTTKNNAAPFVSASTIVKATPGDENSQSVNLNESEKTLTVDPKAIIPGGSVQNFVSIRYKLKKSGFTGSIKIFSSKGLQVKIIIENKTLGTSGHFTWHGLNDMGQPVEIGYYIVWMECFDTNGKILQFKEKVAIGRNF